MSFAGRVVDPIRRSVRAKVQRAVAEVVDPAVQRGVDRAVAATREFELRSRRDLLASAEREAAASSAELVRGEMRSARMLPNPTATLEHALSICPAEGMALEFGVYSGSTLRVIADARGDGAVYGFDSFEGLPEDWRAGYPVGTFGNEMLPAGPPDVPGSELVVGWFSDTLPEFLQQHSGPVAFLHVDCDLYSSCRTVLDHVGPRLRHGSVVVFDEFFNYPGWQDGEYRAWCEHVRAEGWNYDYEAFTVDNEQVVLRVVDPVFAAGGDPALPSVEEFERRSVAWSRMRANSRGDAPIPAGKADRSP